MWIIFTILSAIFLGMYDVAKKQALIKNAVLPVLLLNTLFSALFFIPLIIFSANGNISSDSLFFIWQYDGYEYLYILAKAVIVLLSWVLGYLGLKHLPVTIVGPINAMRPIIVLIGAMLFFSEKLSLLQWSGCGLAVFSFYMLSKVGSLEDIHFSKNRWIFLVILSNLVGAFSALYDKYLFADPTNGGIGLNTVTVQAWFHIFQFMIMALFLGGWYAFNREIFKNFRWKNSIFLVSLFISLADFSYYYALSVDGAMISIVSMLRRSSVIVSFFLGALLFKEKNLKEKGFDLLLIMISILLLILGSGK